MIILKFFHKSKQHEILFEGTNEECCEQYDIFMNMYESVGLMMVNEINIKGTYIREFATENQGHVLDLIMCGGIAYNIYNRNIIKQ